MTTTAPLYRDAARSARERAADLVARMTRDEKLAQRKKEQDPKYHAEMAKLYAQHVLKEQPTLQIQGLGGKKKPAVQEVLHKPQV